MASNFRQISPKRTCTKTYASYRSYKPYLASDFNSRCGYTDCPDFWFGGKNTFHIDHFKPFSKKPELETDYKNLVYCCSYVNILKSDDEGDYLDPCDNDFNEHFDRDTDGSIIPKNDSKEAKYMFSKLQLGLTRYRLIWKLEEMREKKNKIKEAIENLKNKERRPQLLEIYYELDVEFMKYLDYLSANQ
jgi:hypothetical protein